MAFVSKRKYCYFKENKIIKDLKTLSKELHFYLKQNDDVYNPKVRYL